MDLNQRITALVKLGAFMQQFTSTPFQKQENIPFNELFFDAIKSEIELAKHHNPWFTPDNLTYAFKCWSDSLSLENLMQWTHNYDFTKNNQPKTVGLIMAGNIPLVGFHDLISVLITGNKAMIKLASNDKKIIPLLMQYLQKIAPELKTKIHFTEHKLDNFNAIIATGSNNSARYFTYYFEKYPHIIRKNRNSVAVLTGKESTEQLHLLGNDIFRYFGLGCRSVSKLFVPKGYNFDTFFEALEPFITIREYQKYRNNYDYNKAVYLMSLFPIIDNGFLLLKEDNSYASPIATLFFEYYDDATTLTSKLAGENELLQCIVGPNWLPNAISFGTTQTPELWDYADGVDTLNFLLNLT